MIALLGASGYVGQAFRKFFNENRIIYYPISRHECNYYHHSELASILKHRKATALINCAGYTGKPNVDACEKHKAECLSANVYLPLVINEVCQKFGIPWGHVASGCIYQGNNSGLGFSETDIPNFSFRQNNCSFYSGTKALSEEILADAECWQWRLRIPFNSDINDRNYITKLLSYSTLLDVENSFSHLDQFVVACYHCIKHNVPFGVYNMTNGGSATTRQIVELLKQRHNKEFKFFKDEDEFMLVAKTPRSSCVLNNSKAIAAGIPLSHVTDAMQLAIMNYGQIQ